MKKEGGGKGYSHLSLLPPPPPFPTPLRFCKSNMAAMINRDSGTCASLENSCIAGYVQGGCCLVLLYVCCDTGRTKLAIPRLMELGQSVGTEMADKGNLCPK